MIVLANTENVTQLAEQFAMVQTEGLLVFLEGDLGVGKTTFVRAVLRTMGYEGTVKSPTYTLVETYEFNRTCVHHFDLYRLQHPEELDYLGIEDYITPNALVFIEWPDRGNGILPTCDLTFNYTYDGNYEHRYLSILGRTKRGEEIARRLDAP